MREDGNGLSRSWLDKSSFDAIRNGIFFDMEADLGFRRFWGRLEQRAEFLVDVAESAVVEKQGFVNFGQALKDGSIGSEILTHSDERANHINTHGNRAWAAQDIGGHKRAMFGKSVRE